MTITLVPVICDSTAYKDFDKDTSTLQHYIVLYDDEKITTSQATLSPAREPTHPIFLLTNRPSTMPRECSLWTL